MSEDLQAYKSLRRAGIDELVVERQEAVAAKKELEGTIAKLSAKIMGLMIKAGVDKAQVGIYPVVVVSDATYTKFDKQGFLHYLVEKGVAPKLLQAAEAKYTLTEQKRPHLRVGTAHGVED